MLACTPVLSTAARSVATPTTCAPRRGSNKPLPSLKGSLLPRPHGPGASVGAGCLGNCRLRQQWACISVGAGCLGNCRLRQQWACVSVGAGCLGNGGCPSPTERLRDCLHGERLESPFFLSHCAPQTLCFCNPLGWPTVQVSFSLKFSPLKSQVASSTGHPDKRALWGALGQAGRHHPSCRLLQAEPLPGVPCLLYTWEFHRSVGDKDQSENAALTHLSVDSPRDSILGCSHSAILSPPPRSSLLAETRTC